MATASVWQRPPRVEADVAVVGGGVVGAATAHALRDLAPDLRVAVVEAERLAHGASGRNAGFLILGTHRDYASAVGAYGLDAARRLWAFTREAFGLVATVGARRDVGFAHTGILIAAGDDAEADRLRLSRALLAEDGVDTEWWDQADLDDEIGGLGFAGGLFVSEGGVVDPARLVRALAAESGARVVEGCRVEAVEGEGGRVRLAAEGATEVVADRVLLAVNAHIPLLRPDLSHLVRPVRAQMLATAPVPRVLDVPVYSHGGFYYVRQRGDGRVLVGGARHRHRAAEVGYEDATTDALQADLEAYLAAHFPALAGAAVERRWSGTMGFSPDGLPALGPVPDVPGAFWAAGFTGHGLAYAARFGRLAARTLLGEPDDAADLFSVGRLHRAASVRS